MADVAAEHGTSIAWLQSRRSVSPRRLGPPAPAADAVESALRAALRAPDHGALRPWRVIEFEPRTRERLAELFVDEKSRRDPEATADDLARTRAQALEPPALFGFVVRIDAGASVPAHEQWLAAGAALGLLLTAFHALGFGASVLSGERCADAALARALGVAASERLVGFIGVGTVVQAPKAAREIPVARVLGTWQGAAAD